MAARPSGGVFASTGPCPCLARVAAQARRAGCRLRARANGAAAAAACQDGEAASQRHSIVGGRLRCLCSEVTAHKKIENGHFENGESVTDATQTGDEMIK